MTVVDVPDKPGEAAAIFRELADAEINIDMIVQNISTGGTGRTDVSFTLPATDGAHGARGAEAGPGRRSASRICSTTTTSASCRSSARACARTRASRQRSSPRSPTPASTSR